MDFFYFSDSRNSSNFCSFETKMKFGANLIFLILILSACSNKMTGSISKHKVKSIIYRYSDSSVPPAYHRSYTITIDQKQIHLVVDSYGNTLTDDFFESDKPAFNTILNLFNECDFKCGMNREDHRGCSGGTGEKIIIIGSEGNLFDASVYHCGNEDFGTLYGDTRRFADVLRALIPDFQTKLKR